VDSPPPIGANWPISHRYPLDHHRPLGHIQVPR